jgi:HK97 family phage major capsid protein
MTTATSTWVEFEVDHQVNVDGEMKDFTKGQKVAFDVKMADALVALNYAKEVDAPEDEFDGEEAFKALGTKMESLMAKTFEKAVGDAATQLEDRFDVQLGEFAKAKGENYDLEKDFGFKEPDHYFQCVREFSKGASADMTKPGMEFLVKAPSGQNISSDSEGNILVPEPVSSTLWTNAQAEPFALLGMSTQFTTAGNSLKLPQIFEPSRKTGKGQRNAGIIAYWEDEADEHTGSKFTSGKIELSLNKLAVLTYASEEILDDSGFNITGIFGNMASGAIQYALNEAMVNGTGVGKPKGILKDDALITVPLESGQGNHTIFHKNVSNMYWRNMNRTSAVWLVHPDLAQQLEFMYFNDDTTNQRPVYLPANQVVNSPFGLLYGRPVIPFEFMPDFGSVGDITFVDMRQYGTLRKAGAGVKQARSMHVRFLYDEEAFKWTFRVDGRGLWRSAVEDLNGDTTRSWCVTLASRTGGSTSSGL